jgi:hypothetical protein
VIAFICRRLTPISPWRMSTVMSSRIDVLAARCRS